MMTFTYVNDKEKFAWGDARKNVIAKGMQSQAFTKHTRFNTFHI